MKDPTTGRRQARLNPTREWLTHEVPSLRIIDDDLWHRAKARQMDLCFEDGEKTIGGKLNRRHRSQYLLSGLIKCGSCKSNFIIVGKDKYGCATRRTKGTCSNSHVLKRQDIETLVLDGLKEKLIEPVPSINSIRPRDRGSVQKLGVRVRVARIDWQWSGIQEFLQLTEFLEGTGS